MEAFNQIVEGFDFLDPADRLELLIDYGNQLPALAETLYPLRDAGQYMVHECQAPVFLKVDVEQDHLFIHADVPREAPIARGFVAILVLAFDGAPLAELEQIPDDLLTALGIRSLLGMQRTQGLTAIYTRVKEALAR